MTVKINIQPKNTLEPEADVSVSDRLDSLLMRVYALPKDDFRQHALDDLSDMKHLLREGCAERDINEMAEDLEAQVVAQSLAHQALHDIRNFMSPDPETVSVKSLDDGSGFIEGILMGQVKAGVWSPTADEAERLEEMVRLLSEADFTSGSSYSVLAFNPPKTMPKHLLSLAAPTSGRQYRVLNLAPDNDTWKGGPDFKPLGASIASTLGQIDEITEGGAKSHGDIADMGTSRLETSEGKEFTVRRMKMDWPNSASRVPMYGVFSKDGARDPSEPRLLVLASRTSGREHDPLRDAMANV